MSYDAVVFDYDGVLMEPTPLDVLQDAVRDAFEQSGIDPRQREVRDLAISVDYDALLDVCERYGLDPESFWHARDTAFTDHQTSLLEAGEKGVYDDHDAVFDLDYPLGIVSSNQQATLEHHLAHVGLDSHFQAVHGREPHPDSIRKKKPNPHYLHAALDSLGADTALYIGDRESDVQAAHNAGLDSVYVHRNHNDTPTNDPTFEVETLHELPNIVDGTTAATD